MSNTIKGGALEFDIIANNGQINTALDETKKRVQGFTDATVEGGEKMELAFTDAAATIDRAFSDIDAMAGVHTTALAKLEKEYAELGNAAAAAFMKGTAKGDEEYRALTQRQAAVKKEIAARREVMQEIEATADALQKEEKQLQTQKDAVDKNAKSQVSLRTEIKLRREEMAALVIEAQRNGQVLNENTGRYAELRAEIGNLTDLQGDIAQQAKALGNDEGMFQGVVSAIGGITGAMSAAQGVVSLFAGENENLQKVMLKVQSLMAITIGLQQVAVTLNKDSYFSLKILGGIKEWWAGVLAKATVTQTANTAATVANTAAQQAQAGATTIATGAEVANTVATGAQAAAATAGTVANLTLAGAFRAVGAAIMSIPVIGWILAGVAGLIALVGAFTKNSREAKKAAEELRKEVVDIAGKPVAAVQELSHEWAKLGDNLKAKQKFVEDNADKFKELGVSVNSVTDAENLLVNNKTAFINSEIAKAKAMAVRAQAADLVAKALENQQKLDEARQRPTVTRFVPGDPMTGIGSYSYEITNPKIAKFEERDTEFQEEITTLYTNAANYELEGLKILEAAGIQGAEEYAAGTVGAIEQAISAKQAVLKTLSDPTAYNVALKEIEGLQKQVDAITGGNKKKPSTTKTTDPFVEMLEERKKKYTQYLAWVNSGDDITRNAAKAEFAGLLAEGNSYLEFLKKQREKLLELSARTPVQDKNLARLNDEIAAETKDTVLGAFEKDLQTQLTGARSILEMLNVLEERRKQLAGDGSDLDNGKKQVLDTAQADVAKQAEAETNTLLKEYASYLSEKIDFELAYAEKRRLLNEHLAKATTEDERRIVLAALEALDKDRERYSQQTGNEDYDKLVEEYRSYSRRRADIAKEYDEKIALATEQQNAELVQRLTEARNKAISSVALEELQNSGAWEQLFGNLDDLTTRQIESLIAKIEAQRATLGVELDPKDLEAILDKLEEAKDEIHERNPFKALRDGLKAYKEDASKANLNKVFEGVAGSLELVKGSFDAVVGGLEKMGLAGDEITQDLLGDIGDMVGAAGQLAAGIASGNPLGIIQGAIGFISSAFEVFNVRDRRAERAIKKHAEAVKVLEQAYTALSWAVDKALGESVYDNQRALVDNMRKQREHLQAMWQAEEGKKKTDWGKVDEYKSQYEELGRQIEDTIDEIAASITQTTAKDLANDLADAIIEAFGKGEDAAEAFEATAEKVMQNAVKNALKLQFLEAPLTAAIARLQKDMGFDSEGNGTFDGLTEAEQQRFKDAIARIGGNFAEAMKMYNELFEGLEEGIRDPTTTLAGAIKGASQESIDLLAGQTNAVRINQVQALEISREQLLHLAGINAGIGVSNRHLASIDNKISSNNYDPLRAQGITN